MTYRDDRARSDLYSPTIRQIVGPLLMVPTSEPVDRCEATDLIIIPAKDMRIACRIRQHGYFDRFGDEFTIRARRDSGAETEFVKVCTGFGDWFFYGHAGSQAPDIEAWMIVDLAQFRFGLQRVHISELFQRGCAGQLANHDGLSTDGTHFFWFHVPKFAEACKLDRLLVATNIEALKPFVGLKPATEAA